MKILQTFFILSLIIITIYVSALQPKLHKHFILTPANFKLKSVNQRPQDAQSLVLFKIGDVRTETTITEKILDKEEAKRISEETSIIPSSFITSTTETSKTTANNTTNTTTNNSTEMLQQIANMINNNNTNKDAQKYISKFGDYNKNLNTSVNDISKDKTCPACNNKNMNNAKYRDELIAWNVWRSRIQNQIMDDSDVDADYGTVFYFTFKVDKYRNITDVKVICTDPSNTTASSSVRKAILRLRGKAILEFPKGTNRNMVDFTGGFLMGAYSQYSSPGDYNDIEHIRTQY